METNQEEWITRWERVEGVKGRLQKALRSKRARSLLSWFRKYEIPPDGLAFCLIRIVWPMHKVVEEVKKRIAAQYGALPTKKGDKGFPALQEALQEANNDTFTDAEASSALTKIWASNNGKLISDELQAAHAYIAKYLLIDLNSTAVPKLDGQDEIVETLADGRVVRLMGAGAGAGTYLSSPGNLTATTTYGNAVSIAKANSDRASAIAEAKKKAGK